MASFVGVMLLLPFAAQPVDASGPRLSSRAPTLTYTSGGHALAFTSQGMYAATGGHALHIEFVGANAAQPKGDARAAQGTSAPLGELTYAGLWDGIDLTYTGGDASVYTTTYTIAAGADPAGIRLRYNAPVSLASDGSLSIAFEGVTLTETAPIAWQEIGGERVAVDVVYRLRGQELGFALGKYDARYALTIDPSLIWNSFLGGWGNDYGGGIAIGDGGYVYVSGGSTDFWGCVPSCTQRGFTGNMDAFAAKLDPSGAVVWNTFLGGSADDDGEGIALDGLGNVYVLGQSGAAWTCSGTPCTIRPYNALSDIFIAKLATTTGALSWVTFLGGAGSDGHASHSSESGGMGMVVDGFNEYVVSDSDAAWGCPADCTVRDFTSGLDAWLAKVSSTGDLVWNSFVGGSGNDESGGIVLDGSLNAYMAGKSDATWGTSPVRAYTSGTDGYAAKLSSSGALVWNSFVGASGFQGAYGIALDGDSNVYVAGDSDSSWGTPVRPFGGGPLDGYVVKLSPAGALIWNTFLGGGGYDYSYHLIFDGSGTLHVSGASEDPWGNPVRAWTDLFDTYIARLDSSGTLKRLTFLGGSGDDHPGGLAADGSGNVYVAGYGDDPWGTPVRGYSGNWDAYVARDRTVTISGMAPKETLMFYTDGTTQMPYADSVGYYSFDVSYGWSGTVTPAKVGSSFEPATRTYTNQTTNQVAHDYMGFSLAAGGTYDDGYTDWMYAGAWGAPAIPGAYLNTLHIAVTPGSTATFTFWGNRFAMSYLTYPGWGKIGVYLDGSATPATTLNCNTSAGLPVYTSPYLLPGKHTVVFKHAGASGTMIAIDYLAAYLPSTLAAGTYDGGHPGYTVTGAWGAPSIPGLYNDTLHIAVSSGSWVSAGFTGRSVSMSYLSYTGWGYIVVYLDGGSIPVAVLNTDGPVELPTYISPALPAGSAPHTVTFVHAGPAGTMIAIDKIVLGP